MASGGGRQAPGGKAVAQVSDQGPNPRFNLCIAQDKSFEDLDLTVSFKAMAGKIDQGGGPVWRYQDAKNYYVVRMNPLENNYRVYKVVEGKRIQLASADVKASSGQWHKLRVVHKGNHIRCYLNGTLYLDVQDDTLPDAGKIGLWTKADARTRFGGLEVRDQECPSKLVSLLPVSTLCSPVADFHGSYVIAGPRLTESRSVVCIGSSGARRWKTESVIEPGHHRSCREFMPL